MHVDGCVKDVTLSGQMAWVKDAQMGKWPQTLRVWWMRSLVFGHLQAEQDNRLQAVCL